MIRIVEPGPLTLIQDLGRHGYASYGVSPSGAADRGAFGLANRLVGNAEEAAAFEVTLGGLILEFESWATIALTGADCRVHVNRSAVGMRAPVHVPPRSVVRVARPARGLRTYLAVRGGVVARRVLGSMSSDTLSGIGPPPVDTGDVLAVGNLATHWPDVDSAAAAPLPETPVLDLLQARTTRWFSDDTLRTLDREAYQVTPESSRTAVRLSGAPIDRASSGELPPEGLVLGAVQVPHNGQPLVFLADHPVTGGYPVIGVLTDQSCDAAAQLRPGQEMRFRVLRRSIGVTGR